ncbi:glycosyltransferase family 4 protein [Thermodesulfobacteriota bacterium]
MRKQTSFESSKNVLVCTPVLLIGGTEIHTLNLVNVLVSEGFNVSVCCYYEYDESMASAFRSKVAKVVLMDLKRSDGLLHLIRELKAIFLKIKPATAHIQYVAPGMIPIIAAKLSGIRTVFATVHQPGRPYGLRAKLIIRLASLFCTAFFCVSKSVEESWFGDSEVFNPKYVNSKRKHFTIYNAVDISSINKAKNPSDCENIRKSLGLNEHPVIGVIGRLRSEKGHSVLLNAMIDVIKTIPNVLLLVVGDGPDRIPLKEKAESLGVADHVVWLGAKAPEEVLELYRVMDVVAVPSIFEGFGLTAAEAKAAGRPVVASAVDGLKEVVGHDRTGYLVPVGDSNAMAECLIELLTNSSKAQAMGEAGRRRIEQNFSIERFSESILAAYHYFSRC